jgi:WD40 repeat protein
VQLWDTLTGQATVALRGQQEFVQAVAFSPVGVSVATAGVDMTARVWNAATGKEERKLVHPGRVYCVAFSPDGHLLAAGDSDQNVSIWDWAAEKEVHRFSGHTHQVFSLAFSPDGEYVASASWAEVIVWDAANPLRFQTLGGHAVASGYKDKGEVTIWDSARWQIHADEQ